jgi:hypothetical protein
MGQLKAVAMFAAVGGLFPAAPEAQPEQTAAPPPVKAEIYVAEWRREQSQAEGEPRPRGLAAPTADPKSLTLLIPSRPSGLPWGEVK